MKKKKREIKPTIWDDKDDSATFSKYDVSNLEKLFNLCLMTNIDITKKKV